MAWEKRNKDKYYYRKVRAGNKVCSLYLGKDILAYKISEEDDQRKDQMQKQEAQINAEAAVDQALEANHQRIMALAEAALLLNVFICIRDVEEGS